mgnify:CR=1 FL=1
MTSIPRQCFACRHFHKGIRCAALPNGIPTAILEMEHDHRQPYPGDNGIRWEPAEADTVNPFDEQAEGR